MTFEFDGITIDGMNNEETARQVAPLLMESAVLAGYKPKKREEKDTSEKNIKTGS